MKKNIKIIDTDSHKKHGTNKCPNCGASDITYDINSKKLICNFCKTLFEGESLKENNNSVDKLSGEIHSSSLKDIKEGNDVITLKCNKGLISWFFRSVLTVLRPLHIHIKKIFFWGGHSKGTLYSPARDQTHTPAVEGRNLNHRLPGKSP